jgi:hypothetical protein
MITKPSPVERLLRWREKNPYLFKQKRLAGVRNSQKIKDAMRRTAIQYREQTAAIRRTMPMYQKGEQHLRACTWRFRSPNNVIYEFKNLYEFVRNHGDLFDSKDAKWRKTCNTDWCCALRGLAALKPYKSDGSPKRKVKGTWKGWRWYASKNTEEKL